HDGVASGHEHPERAEHRLAAVVVLEIEIAGGRQRQHRIAAVVGTRGRRQQGQRDDESGQPPGRPHALRWYSAAMATPALKHNTYFDGNVQSIGFERHGRRATAGVIAPGEYHFGTEAPERMT